MIDVFLPIQAIYCGSNKAPHREHTSFPDLYEACRLASIEELQAVWMTARGTGQLRDNVTQLLGNELVELLM